MPLWLVRTGRQGQHESRFLDDNRVYLTWSVAEDLDKLASIEAARSVQAKWHPDQGERAVINYASQMWAFVKKMGLGDWVIVPSKLSSTINVAEVTGDYKYNVKAEDKYQHSRTVKWIAKDLPRSNFDADLLAMFGAFSTVCRLSRNNAESRIHAMSDHAWKPTGLGSIVAVSTGDEEEAIDEGLLDVERTARDQIAKLIMAKFKGHGLARLVELILKAQGYTTYLSPEGPDHGIDILAGTGPLGFAEPRLCVQVKSGDSPLDRPTLDQLVGAMQNFHAEQGLLVSWGGFKGTVNKEKSKQFFRVRLWDQGDLIDELLEQYDRLDAEVSAELPLKRIWVLAGADEQE